MLQKPVLLRRTGSSLPSSGRDSAPSSGGAPPLSSGQQIVDPNAAIPIADENPGDSQGWSINSHKRKQSGIPLDAEAIIGRATGGEHMTAIADEEEGSFSGEGGGDMPPQQQAADAERRGSRNNMPEFSDFLSDDQGGWSFKSLVTSRGLAGITLVMVVLGLFTMHGTSNNGAPTSLSSPVAGSGTAHPQNPAAPDSKQITYGEEHMEITGEPMQHHAHEYGKIRFYDSPSKMKPLYSKGPILWDDEMGGLHLFENVCLTTNIDALRYRPQPQTGLRGLIYFTDEEEMMKNPKRCVPCSNSYAMDNWEDANKDRKVVGHKCGMNGLHAMYASSVGDWSDCIMEKENAELMEEWGQTQSPLNVTTIHFFQEPTFLLQFNALDMEESLFDMLMTYLPHWDKFLEDEDGFPFNSVISHSLEGCLSHSHNWFCEVLHQMYAFGAKTKEIPWESDDNTLYCYKELFYNQVGYQRKLDRDGLINKENFGEFRELLFRKFGLPRRRTVQGRLEDMEYEKKAHGKKNGDGDNGDADGDNTKIIFYDNKLSEQRVWNQMESLISKARELEKFQHIKFVTVDKDFNDLSVAQQARKFNEADAVIMAQGQHMANAIFAVDGTSFVEVGCKVESLIGNPKFMSLMDGKYRAVEKCNDKDGGDDNSAVCVKCKDGEDDVNFTMTPAAFEKLIDDVVASL